MKSFLTLILVTGFYFSAISQKNYYKDSEVIFISQERKHSLNDYELSILEHKEVIYFNHYSEIEKYLEDANNTLKSDEANVSTLHVYEIKKWKALHPNLKIIKHSEYENASNQIQQEYRTCSYCMILFGEEITMMDIKHYESEH